MLFLSIELFHQMIISSSMVLLCIVVQRQIMKHCSFLTRTSRRTPVLKMLVYPDYCRNLHSLKQTPEFATLCHCFFKITFCRFCRGRSSQRVFHRYGGNMWEQQILFSCVSWQHKTSYLHEVLPAETSCNSRTFLSLLHLW